MFQMLVIFNKIGSFADIKQHFLSAVEKANVASQVSENIATNG